jgi:hypothetical protein
MSEAVVHPLVAQAACLLEQARGLPVDEAARVCEQVATIAQAVQAEALIDGERSGALADSGCRTVGSFARTILRRSDAEAAKIARVARHLVDLPALAGVYRAGLAHTANLRAIVEYVPRCGLAVMQDHEMQLVAVATACGPRQVHAFCQRLLEVTRPEHDRDTVTAAGLRMVRIHRVGDLAHVDAMIDPEVAGRLKTCVAAMAQAARDPGEPRPYGERQAEAFEDILTHGLTHAMAATDGAGASAAKTSPRARSRTQAVMHVQLETLLGMDGYGRAWLERFGLIPTGLAQRLSCEALVRLVVKHGDLVLNVGTATRSHTHAQRVALSAVHTTCVMPGCGIAFADCNMHHLWWHSLGGPSDLDLLVPLCGTHHRRLHDGDYSITKEHGILVFRDRTGRTIANTTQALADQLHQLHQHTDTGPTGGACEQCHPLAEEILTDIGGWPHTHYHHDTWGWNGHNPNPPPGHAPPQPS